MALLSSSVGGNVPVSWFAFSLFFCFFKVENVSKSTSAHRLWG